MPASSAAARILSFAACDAAAAAPPLGAAPQEEVVVTAGRNLLFSEPPPGTDLRPNGWNLQQPRRQEFFSSSSSEKKAGCGKKACVVMMMTREKKRDSGYHRQHPLDIAVTDRWPLVMHRVQSRAAQARQKLLIWAAAASMKKVAKGPANSNDATGPPLATRLAG